MIPSPDGKYLLIPLIKRENEVEREGEREGEREEESERRIEREERERERKKVILEERERETTYDIITAFSESIVDASWIQVSTINNFVFTNHSNKSIIFPVGCVISGRNKVQDRVLTEPAFCRPRSTIEFTKALCGNIRASMCGELESEAILMPLGVKSGNPLIQLPRQPMSPTVLERRRLRELNLVDNLSQTEISLSSSSCDANLLHYLERIMVHFIRNSEGSYSLKSFLSEELERFQTFNHQNSRNREGFPRWYNFRSSEDLDVSPNALLENIRTHYSEYHSRSSYLNREVSHLRERFLRGSSENIQSQLWNWISSTPAQTTSVYQAIKILQNPRNIPETYRHLQENEVGLLIIGSGHFTLSYFDDPVAWKMHRSHFLDSYFSSDSFQRATRDVDATHEGQGLDDFVQQLLDQILLGSRAPAITNYGGYNVSMFTDGWFQGWGLKDYRETEGFQYVFIHGFPRNTKSSTTQAKEK